MITKTVFASSLQKEAEGKQWVACHFCTSYVPSETAYVIHRAKVHPSDSRNAIFRSSDHSKLADYKRGQADACDVRLPCLFCMESFTAQGSLNTHMNVKHRTGEQISSTVQTFQAVKLEV